MTDVIAGIDLGTTNSEIAVYRDGRPEVLADDGGRLILPSVVGLADDGAFLIGDSARNQYLVHPERTVRSIKRKMGTDETVALGDQTLRPQEVSAIVLRRLKEIAEARIGQAIGRAVITVPAYFSDTQRLATREAGEIAGLEVVRIINEPTAAALAYEAGAHQGRRLMVYDLGGGTFDVSIVRIEGGVVEVISSHGDNHLGGDDFDQLIVDWLCGELSSAHGVDPRTDPGVMARLTRAAETAKKALSDHAFAPITEEFLTERDGAPVHLAVELSRDRYEEMIAPLVERTLEAIHIALDGASLGPGEVEEILLVGGATRTPLIRRRLAEIFGRPPRGEVDPDLCVALGAAIQGGALAGHEVSAVLVDVTPYTFGTSALGELKGEPYPYCYVPIIAKNSSIPVRRSEVFYTVVDDQERVQVRIFQGEDPDALNNIQLGEFTVEGLSQAPSGNPVVLDLALDRDGILHVAAREKVTGLERRITIDNAMPRLDAAALAAARARIGGLASADAESAAGAPAADGAPEAAALLARAQALLETAEAEDREELIDLIEALRDALAADQPDAVAKARDDLSNLLFYLDT